MAAKILVPTRTFNVWVGGQLHTFRRGRTTIREGHPLLDGRESQFRPLRVDYDVAQTPPVAAARPAGAARSTRGRFGRRETPTTPAPPAEELAEPTAEPEPAVLETSDSVGDTPGPSLATRDDD